MKLHQFLATLTMLVALLNANLCGIGACDWNLGTKASDHTLAHSCCAKQAKDALPSEQPQSQDCLGCSFSEGELLPGSDKTTLHPPSLALLQQLPELAKPLTDHRLRTHVGGAEPPGRRPALLSLQPLYCVFLR